MLIFQNHLSYLQVRLVILKCWSGKRLVLLVLEIFHFNSCFPKIESHNLSCWAAKSTGKLLCTICFCLPHPRPLCDNDLVSYLFGRTTPSFRLWWFNGLLSCFILRCYTFNLSGYFFFSVTFPRLCRADFQLWRRLFQDINQFKTVQLFLAWFQKTIFKVTAYKVWIPWDFTVCYYWPPHLSGIVCFFFPFSDIWNQTQKNSGMGRRDERGGALYRSLYICVIGLFTLCLAFYL